MGLLGQRSAAAVPTKPAGFTQYTCADNAAAKWPHCTHCTTLSSCALRKSLTALQDLFQAGPLRLSIRSCYTPGGAISFYQVNANRRLALSVNGNENTGACTFQRQGELGHILSPFRARVYAGCIYSKRTKYRVTKSTLSRNRQHIT